MQHLGASVLPTVLVLTWMRMLRQALFGVYQSILSVAHNTHVSNTTYKSQQIEKTTCYWYMHLFPGHVLRPRYSSKTILGGYTRIQSLLIDNILSLAIKQAAKVDLAFRETLEQPIEMDVLRLKKDPLFVTRSVRFPYTTCSWQPFDSATSTLHNAVEVGFLAERL